jgi:hypothetical protein
MRPRALLLISLWESPNATREYAGPDRERARDFGYDLECLSSRSRRSRAMRSHGAEVGRV